ncbi:hypothetical protein [Streptomyces europaeiscabiei]|uniref:hypothetical protein n=1 Tax=Streptomyces europaeiscabiei TaxID=146819 RepID=UPI0029A93244|nr:hypothetical protein [Streptomyces europaeiscabiei]MDX3671837.1 hypothetical protein [Streptomyces europaeiscabiei]
MTTPTTPTPAPTPAPVLVPATLGEEILLLSLDDTTGEARLPLRTPYAIAAAALLERSLSEDPADAVLPDDAGKWIYAHEGVREGAAGRGGQGPDP